MIYPILTGIVLSAATIIVHGLGTLWWIAILRKRQESLRPPAPLATTTSDDLLPQAAANPFPSLKNTLFVLGFTTALLVLLHIVEVSIWAFAYLLLPEVDSVTGLEEAFYFSTVTFSTLGYGDVVIESSWRILSGIQAMAGNLAFGWSSALLLTTFLKMLERHEASRETSTKA